MSEAAETAAQRLRVTGPYRLTWLPRNLSTPRASEVQIRTTHSAISISSELSIVERGMHMDLGYQTLGVVTQAGQFSGLQVGQRVLTTAGHFSHENRLGPLAIAVPQHVSHAVALCAIVGEEADKGVRKMQPQTSDKVLIAGAGMLGLLSVFNLTRRGVSDVTVLEPDPHRRQLASALGAKATYSPGELPHDAYDIGLECSAVPAGFEELMGHIRTEGKACVLSDGNWGSLSIPAAFHSREQTLVASSAGEDYKNYAQWLWQNADPVLEKLFEQTIGSQQLPSVFSQLKGFPRPVAVLVDWGDISGT